MKKILLPIDNSTSAQASLYWAANFLNPAETILYLLDVLIFTPNIGITEYEKEEAERILENAKQFLTFNGFQVKRADWVVDSAVRGICNYADENGIDQIIMGSHGRQGVSKFLMGSVSQGVYKQANQPVFIVNNGPDSALRINQPEKIVLTEQIKNKEKHTMKILLPIDGSDCCKAALDWASKFLVKTRDWIYLVNVIYFTPDAFVSDTEIENGIVMLNEAKTFFEKKGFQVVKSEYVLGMPSQAICNFADEHQIDQIIIGSHGRQGFNRFLMGSISEGVFKYAKQPVFVINNGPDSTLSISHTDKVALVQGE